MPFISICVGFVTLMGIILTGSKFCLGGSMQKEKGFTLIELLVTIAVMAIVASIAAPSFKAVRAQQKIDYSTKDLEKVLLQARYDAILHRQRMMVNLGQIGTSSTNTLYWSVPDEQTLSFKKFVCTSNKWQGTLIDGVKQLILATDGTAELFRGYTDGDGNAQRQKQELSSIEVIISNGNTSKYVEISPLGKITTKDQSRQDQEC